MAIDPIRDGLNWYAYADNNPVMFVDPLGMEVSFKVNGRTINNAQQGKDGKYYGSFLDLVSAVGGSYSANGFSATVGGDTFSIKGNKGTVNYAAGSTKNFDVKYTEIFGVSNRSGWNRPYDILVDIDYFCQIICKDIEAKVEVYKGVYAIADSTASKAFYNYMTQDRQEANALYIYYYLSKEGWTKEAIAGLLGNMQQESVMNPGAWQRMGSSGNGNINQGYGLVQWTAAGDKFLNYTGLSNIQVNALAANDPKALMDLQLEYLLTTMKPGGGEWLSGEAFVKNHYNALPLDPSTPRNMSYNDYTSSTIDPGELALVFQAHYERSGDYKVEQTEGRLQNRYDYVQDWYAFLKNYNY